MATAVFVTDNIKVNGGTTKNPIAYSPQIPATQEPFTINGTKASCYIASNTSYSGSPTITALNEDSNLWIMYNGSPKGEWANIISQHDGQDHLVYTLENGYKIYGNKSNPNNYDINISIYNPEGAKISTANSAITNSMYCGICILYCAEWDVYLPISTMIYKWSNTSWYVYYTSDVITSSSHRELTTVLFEDSVAPLYTWSAWDHIRGNNGQYRCNLTKIKNGSIGDFSGQVTGDASDFDLISGQSDIWGIFQNMSYGEERTIAWSGSAYMTFKITAESQLPSYANFIFKFYSNQGSLLLTRTELVRWNGTGDDVVIGFYLSFVYDETNQVALFCPVIKMINGTTYKWGYNNQYDATEMLNMWQWLHMTSAGDDDRPYDTGTTDNGGNPGEDPLTNDDMPNVNVPTLSALQTGMVTVYVPDDTELQHIASFLWSDNVIDNFKKYFNNFSDNLISLYVLPYKPSNLPSKGFKVGGLDSDDASLTNVDYITNRFVSIDMGEVTVGGKWNSYLDFSPYTKFNLYLPGVGVQAIDADDIMAPLDKNKNFSETLGSTIKLEYVLDLMTGILVAYVKVNGQIRYQFSGKIGYQIPITGENYNNIVHAFTVSASGLVTTLASGGQTAPFALGAVAAAAINFNKPDVYRGGNLSGSASSMSYKHPYLIRRVPNKPLLVNQDKFTGFPTYKSGKLRDFGGYTEVVEVHAEGFVCTEEEREEIIELLKKGVIL